MGERGSPYFMLGGRTQDSSKRLQHDGVLIHIKNKAGGSSFKLWSDSRE